MYGFPSSQSESYKAGRIVALGANVREVGGDLSESAVHAASYAERALFLADGRIVDDMSDPTADRVLDRIKQLGQPAFTPRDRS